LTERGTRASIVQLDARPARYVIAEWPWKQPALTVGRFVPRKIGTVLARARARIFTENAATQARTHIPRVTLTSGTLLSAVIAFIDGHRHGDNHVPAAIEVVGSMGKMGTVASALSHLNLGIARLGTLSVRPADSYKTA
jgi:hypothetical protein